jgi:hypothetical protein
MKSIINLIAVSALMSTIAMAQSTLPAANPSQEVYVVTLAQQFGIVNLATGAFRPIGSPTPALSNLVPGPEGMLYSLNDFTGDLVLINPDNGAVTVIGPTGLGNFAETGESKAFSLAEVAGKLYLTDFDSNLYHVDASTGHATLIGPTGMPPDPAVPVTFNADGTLNICSQILFGVGNKLYATFNQVRINPATLAVNIGVPPKLWQIDPSSGLATLIGDSPISGESTGFHASARVDGRLYGFQAVITGFSPFGPIAFNQLYTVDIDTGKTTLIRNIDPAVTPIFGAAPVHGPHD